MSNCDILALMVAALLLSCAAAQKPPGCTAADEAAIDASFQAELVQKCAHFTPADPPTQCPDYAQIERKYKQRSEQWYVRCNP